MPGRSDQSYVSARIEAARIINVNMRDWSVDVITEFDHKYMDIQVGMPYFHYINGEGIYVMPEVGAYCYVCRPSTGLEATPFVVAFQAPFDSRDQSKSYRANRPNLNPGDMMFKTRDENFIILRRGGVVQVGATPAAQRMYIPIRNVIKDFCENYNLKSIAGEMEWVVHRDEKSTTGNQMTELQLRIKEKADDPGHVVRFKMGSPDGKAGATKFLMEVLSSGANDATVVTTAALDNAGNVTVEMKKDYKATIHGNAEVKIDGNSNLDVTGNLLTKVTGTGTIETTQDMTLKSSMNTNLTANMFNNIDGTRINLGSSKAVHPLVHGDTLMQLLTNLITQLAALSCPCATIVLGAPAPVVAAPTLSALIADVARLPSLKSFTE